MASASHKGETFAGHQPRPEAGRSYTGTQPRGQETPGGSTLGTATEKVQEMASGVAQQAEQAWESAAHGVQDMTAKISSGAQDAYKCVSNFMGRYPVPMFFFGVGLGFLLARAFDFIPTDMTRRMSQSSAH